MHIALIYGGYSGEAGISKKSAMNILPYFDTSHKIYLIEISKSGWFYEPDHVPVDKNDFSIQINGGKIRFDVAYIMVHGTPGEDGILQAYFDMVGIPYTTSSSYVSMLTFHKYYATLLAKALGVKVAESLYFPSKNEINIEKIVSTLGLPVFVKPATSGSSIGMSKVKKREEMSLAIEKAFEVSGEVLIEKALQGIEVTCGAFREKDYVHILPPTLIKSKKEFFDYEAKYTSNLSEEITPAPIEKHYIQKIQETTGFLYDKFRCKGVVRIDYILQDGELYFLEINTVPGMSEASIIPKQLQVYGLSLTEMLEKIIREALNF
jgi:D-alanine-D-alanine ligase